MVAKKKVVKKEPVVKVNFWGLSSDVENICMDVERVINLLELIAENAFDKNSNLIWLASDLLAKEVEKLDNISNKLMEIHREKNK